MDKTTELNSYRPLRKAESVLIVYTNKREVLRLIWTIANVLDYKWKSA